MGGEIFQIYQVQIEKNCYLNSTHQPQINWKAQEIHSAFFIQVFFSKLCYKLICWITYYSLHSVSLHKKNEVFHEGFLQ